MKYKKIILALLILFGIVHRLRAQVDPHFSQYYANPLWLNPALTGVINGDTRVTGNFKNQWATVGKGYTTGSASVDVRPTDQASVGFTILNQAAGDAGFNYLSAYGSFGYAIAVSRDGNQKVSFGVQAGLINRSFDMTKLQFGSQYNSETGFNPNMPSLENFSSTHTTIFDVNCGIFYYNGDPLSNVNLFGGFSMAHLSRPKDPFSASADNKLPFRYILHGGARIRVNDAFDVTPNALYIRQLNAQIRGLGAYSELKMQNGEGLILGGMYRVNDAAVADVGYHFNNTIIGLSYDFNTSSLTQATAGQGGLELSVSYVFHKRISQPEPICPRL